MSQDGWVKNYRKIEEWQWYTVPNMAHLFQHLIRKANHKDGQWCGVEIKKGQLVCGLPTLSEATGVSIQRLRTCLTRLEASGEITRKSTNRFTIITICKYAEYQVEESDSQHSTNRQATGKQQASNNKQECKNKENEKKKDIRGAFAPLSYRPLFISEKSWSDLVSHRNIKKAAQTERAYAAIISEIEKAGALGFSPDECIDKICQRNWTGFEASWMESKTNGQQRNGLFKKPMSLKEQNARELLGIGVNDEFIET